MQRRSIIDRLRLRKVFGGPGERDPRFVFLFILVVVAVIAVTLILLAPALLRAPVAVLTAPAEAAVGEAVIFDASGSKGHSFTFHWDFGDGNTHDSDIMVEHRYLEVGEYVVVLTVADPFGQSDTVQHTIVIREA